LCLQLLNHAIILGMKKQPKSPCAPAIWKRFTDFEKKYWTELYESFIWPELYHKDLGGKEFKEQREVTAHNMACQAVWKLQEQDNLERALDDMPDHFCRRGKKTEYALMITKDKNGKWQICYADLDNFRGDKPLILDSFSDDKAYPSLLDAVENCKKYLTTRNWKK